MVSGSVKERVLEFLAEYDERGYAVLRAAIDSYVYSKGRRGIRLGDFSFREVVQRLKAWGIDYNPSMLLRILERDYGIVETSYKSSNQHWFRFVDANSVIEALDEYEKGTTITEEYDVSETLEEEDPEILLLKIQIASLNIGALEEKLKKLLLKPRLSTSDIALFRGIAFNEIEQVVSLLKRANDIGYDGEEVEAMRRILSLAARLARKIMSHTKLNASAKNTIRQVAHTLSLDNINE